MEIRDLRPLTAAVAAMVVIDALWTPAVLLWAYGSPATFQDVIVPVAQQVDTASTVFKFATIILFGTWIYRAGCNLVEANFDDLEFSPASRIWWFFVPVASLFKPFQGMRELWNASRGVQPYDTNNSLVSTWWGLMLLSSFSALFMRVAVGQSGNDTTVLWVASVIDIGQVIVAIMLIRGIARAQLGLNGSNLVEVFA